MFLPIYILVSFIGALSLVVFAIGYLYYLYTKEREFEEKQEDVYRNTAKIIEDAEKEASQIIEKAVQKAQKTITETEYVKADLVKNLEGDLNQLGTTTIQEFKHNSADLDEEYKQLFEGMRREYTTKIQTTIQSLQNIAGAELDEFAKNLKKETLNSEVFIGARINEEFDRKQKEIEEYKNQRLKIIDQNINKILARVSEQVLGRALPIEQHEALVIEALSQAKKEGVFI